MGLCQPSGSFETSEIRGCQDDRLVLDGVAGLTFELCVVEGHQLVPVRPGSVQLSSIDGFRSEGFRSPSSNRKGISLVSSDV